MRMNIGTSAPLRDRVFNFLEKSDVPLEQISSLREIAARGEAPKDYADYSLAHLHAYFWVNYLKVRSACRATGLRPRAGGILQAVDLGAGSGPASVALVDYLRDDIGYSGHCSIGIVERCAKQLELFEKIAAPYLEERNVEQTEVSLVDAIDLEPSIIVASYFLSELQSEKRAWLLSTIAGGAMQRNLDVLVVDEPHQHIIEQTAECHSWPTVVAPSTIPVDIPRELMSRDSTKTRFSLNTGLFRSLNWQRDSVPEPLLLYARAWTQHDSALIEDLFDIASLYEISTTRALTGLGEIVEYWNQNGAVQRDVEFHIGRWAEDGDHLRADWTSRFHRIDLGQDMLLTGSMSLRLSGDKIVHFAEYYLKEFE